MVAAFYDWVLVRFMDRRPIYILGVPTKFLMGDLVLYPMLQIQFDITQNATTQHGRRRYLKCLCRDPGTGDMACPAAIPPPGVRPVNPDGDTISAHIVATAKSSTPSPSSLRNLPCSKSNAAALIATLHQNHFRRRCPRAPFNQHPPSASPPGQVSKCSRDLCVGAAGGGGVCRAASAYMYLGMVRYPQAEDQARVAAHAGMLAFAELGTVTYVAEIRCCRVL